MGYVILGRAFRPFIKSDNFHRIGRVVYLVYICFYARVIRGIYLIVLIG